MLLHSTVDRRVWLRPEATSDHLLPDLLGLHRSFYGVSCGAFCDDASFCVVSSFCGVDRCYDYYQPYTRAF